MADFSSIEAQAKRIKLLAHPTKLMIIQILREKGAMSLDEIRESAGISHELTRQYLRSMESIHVIKSKKKGDINYFYIEDCELLKLIEKL